MTKEQIREYTLRVTQGNKSDLIVTTYDIILTYINTGINEFEKEKIDDFIWNIKKAAEFLSELIHSLDFKYEISYELMSLYLFIQKVLNQAVVKKRNQDLTSVIRILENLKVGFEKVAKADGSGPVMENAGQVYAGLTYGKGTLNESYDKRTGFRV
jgi:flagellar secretion chaperone FliS